MLAQNHRGPLIKENCRGVLYTVIFVGVAGVCGPTFRLLCTVQYTNETMTHIHNNILSKLSPNTKKDHNNLMFWPSPWPLPSVRGCIGFNVRLGGVKNFTQPLLRWNSLMTFFSRVFIWFSSLIFPFYKMLFMNRLKFFLIRGFFL